MPRGQRRTRANEAGAVTPSRVETSSDSERDERVVVRRKGFLLPRPPNEDPDQLPPLGRAPRPFPGRPGTGQNRTPLGARDDIAMTVQRMPDLLVAVGKGHDGSRCVGDRRQLRGQPGIERGKEIGGGVGWGGDDDRIRLDRSARRSLTCNPDHQTVSRPSRITEHERSPAVPESRLQRPDQSAKTTGRREKRGHRRGAGSWRQPPGGQHSFDQPAVPALRLTQLGERRGQTQLVTVSSVDSRHQGLDETLPGFPAEAAANEASKRFVACRAPGGEQIVEGHASLAER